MVNDWMDFKDKLKKRFKPSRGGSVVDQLMTLTQKGSADEYREVFEELSVEAPHIPNDVMESLFLKGLKKSLREHVVRYRPSEMDDIVDIVKLIEAQENEKFGYQMRSFHISVPSSQNQRSFSSATETEMTKKPATDTRKFNPC